MASSKADQSTVQIQENIFFLYCFPFQIFIKATINLQLTVLNSVLKY